jgi:hypothetical protein
MIEQGSPVAVYPTEAEYRHAARVAAVAAVLVPPPFVGWFLLTPFRNIPGGMGFGFFAWLFLIPVVLIGWVVLSVLWLPLIGGAGAVLWRADARVPAAWSQARARAALVAGGAGVYVAAGLVRAGLLAWWIDTAPGGWSGEVRWALLPLAAFGAAAGGCLARARWIAAAEATAR